MPFTPVNDILSQSTLADACGVSGIGANGDCQLLRSDAAGRQGARLRRVRDRHAELQHRLEQRRAERRRRVAAERAAGWLRTLLGDPEQATLRAGYSVAYDRQGHGHLHRTVRRQPRQHAEPDAQRGQWAARPSGLGPDLAGAAPRPQPAARRQVLPVPASSMPGAFLIRRRIRFRRGNRADNVNIFHPDIQIAQRAILDGQLPALALTRHRVRHPLRRHARRQPVDRDRLQRRRGPQHHRERLLQRVPAGDGEPAGEQRRRRRPRRVVHLLRPGHRHQPAADLSRPLQRVQGCRQSGGVLGRELDQYHVRGAVSIATTRIRSTRPRISTTTRRVATTRPAPGCRAELLLVNPDVDQSTCLREQGVQQLSRAADRAPPSAVTRAPDQRQLPVRARRRLRRTSGTPLRAA